MPKRESKKAISREEVLKIVRANVNKLEAEPADRLVQEEIVCKFFKSGNYPQCSNCIRHIDTLNEHTEWYIDFMKFNPCLEWKPELQSFNRRPEELVSPDSLDNIGLNCESCYLADTCPLFKANSLCAVDWAQSNVERKPKSVLAFLIDRQIARVQRGIIIEEIDGGVPDANLSSEMDRLHGLVETLNELDRDKFSLKIEGEAQNKGGSILASIFGGALGKGGHASLPPEQVKQTIEVQDVEVEPVEKVKTEAKE